MPCQYSQLAQIFLQFGETRRERLLRTMPVLLQPCQTGRAQGKKQQRGETKDKQPLLPEKRHQKRNHEHDRHTETEKHTLRRHYQPDGAQLFFLDFVGKQFEPRPSCRQECCRDISQGG